MRKSTLLFLGGLLCLTLWSDAGARDLTPKRKRPARGASAQILKILQETKAAAEQARDEARRAAQTSDSLSRRLEQATLEVSDLKSQISDLRSQISDFRSQSLDGEADKETVVAQAGPPEVKDDSKLDARLSNLEEQVEMNAAQIKEQAQTKVESDSKFRIRLTGALLMNTYFNSADSADLDLPLYAYPASSNQNKKRNNIGGTLRQTRLGFSMSGPRVGGARLSAEADFDFWGGATSRSEGDVLGVLRIRTASARLDWDRTSIEIGQMSPMFSPRSPNSIAAVWYSPLAGAGNLWQWRPQINVEHRAPLSDSTEVVLQAGFMPNFNELFRGETLEGDPGYQGRVLLRRKMENDRSAEIGFGGYYERRQFRFEKRVGSFALTTDWSLPLADRLTLSGEAYYGRSINLGEPGGGRIDRLYAVNSAVFDASTLIRGVRTSGGWAQLSFEARSDLEFNLAYGKDDPNDNDIRFGQQGNFTRFKNQVGSANFIYHMRHNFVVSVEYRRLLTDYNPGRRSNNHVNLAFGYLF
jgi:hypothetical protein